MIQGGGQDIQGGGQDIPGQLAPRGASCPGGQDKLLHRRCSAVSRKTAFKCFTASFFSAYIKVFVKVLTETNVNISNELNVSDVYRSVNYIGSLAKFT